MLVCAALRFIVATGSTACCSRPRLPPRSQTLVARLRSRDQPMPTTAAEVVAWAAQEFHHETAQRRPDAAIHLAKACLLLALEDEAAAQLDTAPAGRARTAATASTWSLQRLDALAAEVVDALAAQEEQEQQQPGSCAAALAAVRQQAQLFPMQVLGAVNNVVFVRHGYAACNRFGGSSDSQLAAVLEDGPGSCAALCILYLEVCSRLGLELGFKVLDEGRYCLVWPRNKQQPTDQQQQPQHARSLLSVGGHACVVDVYGQGALLTVQEATELFGLSEQELLAGSSRRELLACLLTEQQTSHYCTAVGCSPSPLLMTPLTAYTAVSGTVRQLHGGAIERAAAAAEKRLALLPGDARVQLEFALLCYFRGDYQGAYLELGSYLERAGAGSAGQPPQQQVQQQQVQQQQQPPGASPAVTSSALGSQGSSSSNADVTELHASVQSMLFGGAAVQPPPGGVSAAEAALLSPADEAGRHGDAKEGAVGQETAAAMLLFQKLQLELMVQGTPEGGEARQ